jgi:hypothetical protein
MTRSNSAIHRILPAPGGPGHRADRAREFVISDLGKRIAHLPEWCFAWRKDPMGLAVLTIGIARARVKIGLASLFTNMRRIIWLTGNAAAPA